MGRELILVFAKYPRPGRTKTRLAASVGDLASAALARCFLLEEMQTIQSLNVPTHLYYTPKDDKEPFTRLLQGGVLFFPQKGSDLGERMHDAFVRSFGAGSTRVLLLGSDLPDLPAEHVREGLRGLRTHRAVLAPTLDGGYSMIGFRADGFCPECFQNMDWGSNIVYEQTVSRILEQGLSLHKLPPWSDVDRVEDLGLLLSRSPDSWSARVAFLLAGKAMMSWNARGGQGKGTRRRSEHGQFSQAGIK